MSLSINREGIGDGVLHAGRVQHDDRKLCLGDFA